MDKNKKYETMNKGIRAKNAKCFKQPSLAFILKDIQPGKGKGTTLF